MSEEPGSTRCRSRFDAGPLAVEVRLVERLDDRVRVVVHLLPAEPMIVDGLSVELLTDECEALGHRVELPVNGPLDEAMEVRAEVRSEGPMPPRAVVVAAVWREGVETRAWCPADPWTAFEAHVRGRRVVSGRPPADDRILEGLVHRERRALVAFLPWMGGGAAEGRRCSTRATSGEGSELGSSPRVMDEVDEVSDALGLSESDADLLREILGADEG